MREVWSPYETETETRRDERDACGHSRQAVWLRYLVDILRCTIVRCARVHVRCTLLFGNCGGCLRDFDLITAALLDCEEECRELHIRPFFLLTTLSAACKRLGTRPSSWPPFLSQRGGASTCSTFRHGRPHRASCRHLCRGYFGLHVTHLWDHGPCLAVCRCPQPPTGFPHTISESSAGLSKEGPAREHERAARVSSTTTSASTLRR